MDGQSFPRQKARTRNFRLGAPRNVSVVGDRVVFCRSASGVDPVNSLWVMDLPGSQERCVASAPDLIRGEEDLPAAERARRERMREVSSGITGYSLDDAGRRAAFALSGQLYVVDLDEGGSTRLIETPGLITDPRVSPTGRHVAFVMSNGVHLHDLDTGTTRELVVEDVPTVTWGLADFIAAEELNRNRGLWWLGDDHLLIERVDEAPVRQWHISDPAQPEIPPTVHRYPVAGSPNADVTLWLSDLSGDLTQLEWDRTEFCYLASVHVSRDRAVISLLDRLQRRQPIYAVSPTDRFTLLDEIVDTTWVDMMPGTPCFDRQQQLVTIEPDASDTYRLCVDRHPVTPVGLQVAGILDITSTGIYISASYEAPDAHVYVVSDDGQTHATAVEPGVFSARASDEYVVISGIGMDDPINTTRVFAADRVLGTIRNLAETPSVRPAPHFVKTGHDALNTAVCFPSNHEPGSTPLPVILAPYGGPHALHVVRSPLAFTSHQWLADQGYAVVVADGHGTPGRGPSWERSIHHDFVTQVLHDQVAALHGAVDRWPDDLDLNRVGIHGWSFGGYLAALAVLERPDVFHAAIAGAPVTEWRLYDTGYTERYLGLPETQSDVYDANSLLTRAPKLERPLMLIHGLADDNVVVAHTLQMSSALLAAGKPHSVLPLSGVTHMTPQEVIAENLLRLQVEFFNQSL